MQQNFANFVFLHFASSAETQLRCGEKYGIGFVATFYSKIQQCKNLENRPTFVKIMKYERVAQFF